MTFSIEDLPAPFGPMIARTSCSRTSNEPSRNAWTPPKDSDTPSTARITPPMRCARSACCRRPSLISVSRTRLGRLLCRGRREGARVADREVGRYHAGAAVLVAHLDLDVRAFAAVVERIDERRVFLADMAAAHFAGSGELAVVGVELLVQNEEAVGVRTGEARVAGEVRVPLLDGFADQLAHLGTRSEVDVARVRQVALLGPVADGLGVHVDEGACAVAPVPEGDRLLDVGEELELVLEILGRKQRALGELADVLHAIDDLQVPVGVHVARIAGVEPALSVLRLGGRLRILVVLLEKSRRADQELALGREAQLDAFHRGPGRVGLDLA